jgi:hypothetical protein
MRSLLLGGLLPVVAYTIVEAVWGTIWGLVAGKYGGAITFAGGRALLLIDDYPYKSPDGTYFYFNEETNSLDEMAISRLYYTSSIDTDPIRCERDIRLVTRDFYQNFVVTVFQHNGDYAGSWSYRIQSESTYGSVHAIANTRGFHWLKRSPSSSDWPPSEPSLHRIEICAVNPDQ